METELNAGGKSKGFAVSAKATFPSSNTKTTFGKM